MDGLRTILSNAKTFNIETALIQQVVSASSLLKAISDGTAFLGLILAACACSARFSTHHQVRASKVEGSSIAATLAKIARGSIDSYRNDLPIQIEYIKTFCVLIEYEASTSYGRIAWMDLAMARSMTQLCRASNKLSAEESHLLDSISYFLAVSEATYCLGQPNMSPAQSFSKIATSHTCPFELTKPSGSQRLLSLVRFLSRIQWYRTTGFGRHKSPPWHQDSDFRALHEELETHLLETQLLRQPDTPPCSEMESPNQPSQEDDLSDLICSLLCHCCDIELNNSFLPISDTPPKRYQDQSPPPRSVSYPNAPALFLAERKNRCIFSALAICDYARDIIIEQGFFKYMLILGYCCMQSLLLLLHEVKSGPESKQPQLNKNVAFLRNVIGGVGKFYSQGKNWLDTMDLVRDAWLDLSQLPDNSEGAFEGYFSRFRDISEPLCVPLDPSAPRRRTQNDKRPNDSGYLTREWDPTTPSVQGRGSSWAVDYTDHLSGYISDQDAEQGANEGRSSISSTGSTYFNDLVPTKQKEGDSRDDDAAHSGGQSKGPSPLEERERLPVEHNTTMRKAPDHTGNTLEDSNDCFAQLFQCPLNLSDISIGELGVDMDAEGILEGDLLFTDEDDSFNFLREHVSFPWDTTIHAIPP
ncbi:unnamed protein product [Clonostachys rosea]|uniref:Transcription factor domain-containing protein n=1 Tax=Bionectria ochroleuca TaxID=29856 RepID=A0ABY6TXG6_BIOOC|nr:unnamed protein product [Clonostachys rosea]